jgi:hypothetical protein
MPHFLRTVSTSNRAKDGSTVDRMTKAELKTKATAGSVDVFINAQSPEVAADCRTIMALMTKATGEDPKLWGSGIVGFGRYHYTYASGREGDWFLLGFSPRKANITLYISGGFDGAEGLLDALGNHTIGKGCLHIKRLAQVDLKVLEKLLSKGVKEMEKMRV